MCIIVVTPKEIEKSTLETCWENNPDGAGFMFLNTDKKVIVYKGFMTFKEFYDAYKEILPTIPVGHTTVIHFRKGNRGLISKNNCHPFWVHDNEAMAYNGTVSNIPKHEVKSDTAIFAEILKTLPKDWLKSKVIDDIIFSLIKSDKMVVLNGEDITIFNDDLGVYTENKTVWFSNESFKPIPKKVMVGFTTVYNSEDEDYVFPKSDNVKKTYEVKHVGDTGLCICCGQTKIITDVQFQICKDCEEAYYPLS